jgi:serine/threonine protein kinase
MNKPKKTPQQKLVYLGNEYTVGRLLGTGGYGEVREAIHLKTGRHCAIKFISEKGLGSLPDELLAMEIRHRNVLSLNKTGTDFLIDADGRQEKKHFLEMDVADGGELFDWIAHGGRFDEDIGRYYFSEAIRGIKAMHDKGLAHRDLKPENLLLDKDMVLKLADFGLVGLLTGRDGSGLMKSNKGTEGYKAPEIVERRGKYDGRAADIFSMGVILFIMLTRAPPFGGDAS